MEIEDYKNLINVEKENLINDLDYFKNLIIENDFVSLDNNLIEFKQKLHTILVYKITIGEILSKDEYNYVVQDYCSEYYETNSFDYFEILFDLDIQEKLPKLYNKCSNKDYLIKNLFKHLKNCIDSKNYTYDAITYFIDKYCSLIELYNKKYKSNFITTCEYKIQIFILKMYLKYRIRV